MAGEEELVTASRPSRSPPKKLYAEGRTKTTLRWRTATKKLPDPARRTPYAGGLVWKLLWDSLYTLSTVNCRLFQFPSSPTLQIVGRVKRPCLLASGISLPCA